MINHLSSLGNLMEPGISLAKREVIRRYRSMKGFNAEVLSLLCMLSFSILGKTEKGDLYLV